MIKLKSLYLLCSLSPCVELDKRTCRKTMLKDIEQHCDSYCCIDQFISCYGVELIEHYNDIIMHHLFWRLLLTFFAFLFHRIHSDGSDLIGNLFFINFIFPLYPPIFFSPTTFQAKEITF